MTYLKTEFCSFTNLNCSSAGRAWRLWRQGQGFIPCISQAGSAELIFLSVQDFVLLKPGAVAQLGERGAFGAKVEGLSLAFLRLAQPNRFFSLFRILFF